MKSMIKVIGLGIILFGLSASASYFLLTPKETEEELAADVLADDSQAKSPGELAEGVFQQPPVKAAEEGVNQEQLPVAIRPESATSFDIVTQLSNSIREKEKFLKRREEDINKDESRIKMMFDDLKREQSELQSFAAEVDQKTQFARELLEKLKQERTLLANEKAEVSKLQKSTSQAASTQDVEAAQRVKKVQGWFQDMEADVAAKYVKTMADGGELKSVSAVLQGMDQRKAAEILTALGDEVLARQILDLTIKGNN
jgi:predicted RNase H-like nuclease (RuvC/YqgF family)